MQSWSLEDKILHAEKRIHEFYKHTKGMVYVAFSGGKDSSVLLHLVRKLYPDTVAVFSNTTNEYLEILNFVKYTENVITINPEMSFNDTVKEYGFPLVSKKVAIAVKRLKENKPTTKNVRNLYLTGITKDGKKAPRWKLAKKWYPLFQEAKFDITAKCCEILKHNPMDKFKKETGLFPFVGTMASEGGFRKSNWLDFGCNIIGGDESVSKPLSIWNEKDVWDYIKKFNIPYSDIYNDVLDENGDILIRGENRTGCAYCAFGADQEKSNLYEKNRFERLKLRKPKQYEKMMKLQNNGVSFSEALSFVGVNH